MDNSKQDLCDYCGAEHVDTYTPIPWLDELLLARFKEELWGEEHYGY